MSVSKTDQRTTPMRVRVESDTKDSPDRYNKGVSVLEYKERNLLWRTHLRTTSHKWETHSQRKEIAALTERKDGIILWSAVIFWKPEINLRRKSVIPNRTYRNAFSSCERDFPAGWKAEVYINRYVSEHSMMFPSFVLRKSASKNVSFLKLLHSTVQFPKYSFAANFISGIRESGNLGNTH